jgi:prepilin-type N-terminal cleavage/methylation domain-containing protein
MKSNTNRKNQGFTLIELLVVVAIISLLTSIALLAYQNARQKSRDAKRLSDMTQLANAMEIYFSYYKGFPSSTMDMKDAGVILTIPHAPTPQDGDCPVLTDINGNSFMDYSYYPSPTGSQYVINGKTLYPDYNLSFCLGGQTGNFPAGPHYLTSKGIK